MKSIDQKCIEIFKLLELKSDIYDLKINDVPIWWFVRLRFYEKLHDYLEFKEKKELYFKYTPPSLLKIIAKDFKQILVVLFRIIIGGFFLLTNQIKKGRILFFTYQQNKREWEGDKQIDPFVGRIFEKLAEQSLLIEQVSFSEGTIDNIYAYKKRTIFFDYVMFISSLKNVFSFFKKNRISNWEKFEKNCKKIDYQIVSTDWIITTVEEVINSNINKVFIQIAAAETIIKKLKPKLVIETVSYNSGTVALNYIAKKYSIPIIELQHGIFSRSHLGYLYFLPQKQITQLTPDKILVYGDFSKKIILEGSNGFSPQQIQVVGYPRLSTFLENNSLKKEIIRKDTRKKLGIDYDNFLIVVTSHRLISSFYVKFLKKALPLLGEKITICIKLHPADNGKEERRKYKEIINLADVRIITDETLDLYQLLTASDLNFTAYSTVFLECLALGVPNIIIDINQEFANNLPGILHSKNVIIVDNPNDFSDKIKELVENNNLRSKYIDVGRELADYFFKVKENAGENIIKEINKFL